jgi:hypothetical protein
MKATLSVSMIVRDESAHLAGGGVGGKRIADKGIWGLANPRYDGAMLGFPFRSPVLRSSGARLAR